MESLTINPCLTLSAETISQHCNGREGRVKARVGMNGVYWLWQQSPLKYKETHFDSTLAILLLIQL